MAPKSPNRSSLLKSVGLIAYLALCVIGGLLVAIFVVEQTIYNADTVSHFLQTQLISSGSTINPAELSFSRIPSIFPDLVTLIALTGGNQKANLSEILPSYAWIISSLLIFLQSEFIFFTLNKKAPRLQIGLVATNTILAIASISPQFRESLGFAVTPVHHGGNVICTYLLGILLVWNPKAKGSNNQILKNIKTMLAAATIVIGLASNRLFAFNAIAPAILAVMIATWPRQNPRKARHGLNHIFEQFKSKKIFLISAIVGVLLPRFINQQCSPRIVISAIETYSNYGQVLQANNYFIIAIGILAALAITAWRKIRKHDDTLIATSSHKTQPQQQKAEQLLLGTSFLIFAGLSPLIYIWLFGDHDLLQIRHVLIIPGIAGVALSLAGTKLLEALQSAAAAITSVSIQTIFFIALSIISAFNVNFLGLKNLRIYSIYKSSIMARSNESLIIAREVKRNNLQHGLSDFWDITIADVAKIGNAGNPAKSISIEPISRSGKPDLWGHTKSQFTDENEKIKPYNFVITENKRFETSILDNFGEPSEIIDINQSEKRIYIYRNQQSIENINKIVGAKLNKFKRQCNRGLKKFSER